jgi:hypothetical protein
LNLPYLPSVVEEHRRGWGTPHAALPRSARSFHACLVSSPPALPNLSLSRLVITYMSACQEHHGENAMMRPREDPRSWEFALNHKKLRDTPSAKRVLSPRCNHDCGAASCI